MAFPVAIQMYSIRDDVEKNLYGTLKNVKALGYDGVEFAGLYGHTAEEIRDMCADIGLAPVSAHVSYFEMVDDPEKVLGEYAAIGCKYVAIPLLSPGYRMGDEHFSEVLTNIAKLGKIAKQFGMTLLYHNHDFEFGKTDGKYGLDLLYDSIPADLLQTELDTCWIHVGGEDPADYILKYSGRSPVVHLKDFVGDRSERLDGDESKAPPRPKNLELRPVGSGKQDFLSILKAAEKAGSIWLVVEQDNPSMGLSPMECAEKSRAYLKSIGY